MNHKRLLTIIVLLLTLIGLACSITSPETSTPRPQATSTPRPTDTPLPPKPVVPYTPVPADMLSPIIIQRSPKRGESLAPEGAIELVFDKAMDQNAVEGAFALHVAGDSALVKGRLTWTDARTLRFALPRNFRATPSST